MRPAQAGIYLPVGTETGGVTALVPSKADGRVCAEPCVLKIHDGSVQGAA